jgi:hypothetical protein
MDSSNSGQGLTAISCKQNDEPLGSGTTELVSYTSLYYDSVPCSDEQS